MKAVRLKALSLQLITSTLLLCASTLANAAIISGYGTYASASSNSRCDECVYRFSNDNDGGEFSTNANASDNAYGTARAQASLSGEDFTSVLRVQAASSSANNRAHATAMAVQGYNYTGTGSTTYELDLNLHGSVTGNPQSNNLRLDFAIFKGDLLDWHRDYATLVYEFAEFGSLERLERDSMFIFEGFDINNNQTVSFEANEGDSFYIITSMGARGNAGNADGWNTFTMSFADATGLQAASMPAPVVAVSEPGSLALLGSMLSALLVVRRKRA